MPVIPFDQLGPAISNRAKQHEFAGVVTLTKIAVKAKVAVQESLRRNFTLRNKFVEKGVRIIPATKKTKMARVLHVDKFIAEHETGAIRNRPTSSPNSPKGFRIPSFVRDTFGISESKKIPKAKRASKVLDKKIKGNFAFVGKSRKGKRGIFLREKGGDVRMLYVFHDKSIRIEKKPFFFKAVSRVYFKNIDKVYKQELRKALATAR